MSTGSCRVVLLALGLSVSTMSASAQSETLTISGSETGENFKLSACQSGQVLVGVAARQGWYMDNVAPLCSAVTSTGKWSGAVSQRAGIGGPGGTIRIAQCYEDDAVVGMSGKIGRWVTALTIRCRKLASASTVSSSIYTRSAGGATTGTLAPILTCSANRPVVTLSGRYGWYVNQLMMTCFG
jgi:hypothetical protein